MLILTSARLIYSQFPAAIGAVFRLFSLNTKHATTSPLHSPSVQGGGIICCPPPLYCNRFDQRRLGRTTFWPLSPAQWCENCDRGVTTTPPQHRPLLWRAGHRVTSWAGAVRGRQPSRQHVSLESPIVIIPSPVTRKSGILFLMIVSKITL